MLRPIRMAPVLYGKDAEYFYEAWQKSLEEPSPLALTEEEDMEFTEFYIRNERRKLDELEKRLLLRRANAGQSNQ